MAERSLKLKVKKKKWYPIIGPELFSERKIGEIPLENIEQAKHRTVKVNAMNYLGDVKKQHVNLQFIITETKENKAYAKTIGYEITNPFIKRLVRKKRDKITDSFLIKTKDELTVRAKPLIITQTKVSKEVQTSIRLKTRELLTEYAKNNKYEQIINELMHNKLQKYLKEQLHKITTLRTVELKNFSITIQDRLKTIKEEKKKEKNKEEKKEEEVKPEENKKEAKKRRK